MGIKMEIREAMTSDIGAITDLMVHLGYSTTFENMKMRLYTIQQHPDYHTLVAAYDGEIVGMIGLSKSYYYEMDGFYIRILALVVHSNYRNKGIGKKLMADAENWARGTGAVGLSLNSGNRPERMAAHRFYKKQGYSEKSIGFVKSLI